MNFLTYIFGEKEATTLYFAYGSNMLKERLEERVGKINYMGKATLSGYHVNFSKLGKDGSGKATLSEDIDQVTEGAIYRLTQSQIKKLNRFEGYPKHYTQIQIQVTRTKDQTTFTAMTYVAHSAYVQDNLFPTKEYLDFILRGAKQIEADQTYLRLKEFFLYSASSKL